MEWILSRHASALLDSLICDNRYMHICEEIDDGEALHHSRHTPGGDQDVACGAGVRAAGGGLVCGAHWAGVFL